MPLRIYLDECADSNTLARLLQQAGHDVERSRMVGHRGWSDERVMDYAVSNDRVIVTKNPGDFYRLHQERHASGALVVGVLAVHQDNDPTADMNDAEIAQAVAYVEYLATHLGGQDPRNQFMVLNPYRGHAPPKIP